MEQEIHFCNKDFNFSSLLLSQPVAVQGGAYFTKIKCNQENFYIQLPKCSTKQGLVETNKKAYLDLMYTNENEEIIEWFECLEKKLIELIYNKKELWFENDMDMSDFENFFNPITRAYRGGKNYLIRIFIPKNKNLTNQSYQCSLYDENENALPIQDLNENHYVIPILEIQGIKFSARSFQVELIGKQLMILNNKPIFDSCLIKKKKNAIDSDVEIKNVLIQSQEGEISSSDKVIKKQHDKITDQELNDKIAHKELNDENVEKIDSLDGSDFPENDKMKNLTININTEELTNDELSEMEKHDKKDLSNKYSEKIIENMQSDKNSENINQQNLNQETENKSLNEVNTLEEKPNEFDEPLEKNVSNYLNDLEKDLPESQSLEDITIDFDNISKNDTLVLKKPNEVYYEIYKIAKRKAKQHKNAAISHYLEAKKIKNTYLLNNLDNSDSSSDEDDLSDTEKINNEIEDQIKELS